METKLGFEGGFACNTARKVEYILEKLSSFMMMLSFSNSCGLYNHNHHAEAIVLRILEVYFGCEFSNVNSDRINAEGIDLVSKSADKKIVVQVSTERRIGKVRSSMKVAREEYPSFEYYYFCLNIMPLPDWKNSDFEDAGNSFSVDKNILNFYSVLRIIKNDHEKIEQAYDIVRQEFGINIDSDNTLDETPISLFRRYVAILSYFYKRLDLFANNHAAQNVDYLNRITAPESQFNSIILDTYSALLSLSEIMLGKSRIESAISDVEKVISYVCAKGGCFQIEDLESSNAKFKQGLLDVVNLVKELGANAKMPRDSAVDYLYRSLNGPFCNSGQKVRC